MTDDSFASMRRAMVASQLRTNAVNDARVVEAMGAVPRELFVPPEQTSFAYLDRGVPLGGGRSLNLPLVIGRLLTEVQPVETDRALLVGAATGYTAALLARLTGSVVALEEDARLAARARELLTGNVEVVEGPLAEGWPAGAPYDLVVIDGAVEAIPDAIVAQLADGGRLAACLRETGVSRLVVGRKAGEGFGVIAFADADAVPLPGFARPTVFSF